MFLHTLFLENEEEISKKNTEQCFLTKMKSTCQILVTFEHVENRRKTGRMFLPRALQLVFRCAAAWGMGVVNHRALANQIKSDRMTPRL